MFPAHRVVVRVTERRGGHARERFGPVPTWPRARFG